MRILFVVQGRFGERIAEHVREHAPQGWETAVLALPRRLPQVVDDPDAFLPPELPASDLLVSLHETPGAADLVPDIASRCGARAVLAAVDDGAACPPGLKNQVGRRLAKMGVAFAFPRPLCAFDGGSHPLLEAFAASFGRPRFRVVREGDRVTEVEVLRDAPCGSGRFVAGILAGVRASEAPDVAGLRHGHYPCLASMAIDPDLQDTILHLSGHIVRAAVKAGMK